MNVQDDVASKTFAEISEKPGYGIQITYAKKEAN